MSPVMGKVLGMKPSPVPGVLEDPLLLPIKLLMGTTRV